MYMRGLFDEEDAFNPWFDDQTDISVSASGQTASGTSTDNSDWFKLFNTAIGAYGQIETAKLKSQQPIASSIGVPRSTLYPQKYNSPLIGGDNKPPFPGLNYQPSAGIGQVGTIAAIGGAALLLVFALSRN